jgi:hypothetical protein
VHFVASRDTFGPVAVMQSAFVSQAVVASLLHVPAAVPSPGSGSLQVPLMS